MPRTYTQLYYHVVFSTKHRLPVLSCELAGELYPLVGAVVRDQGGALIAVGGMPDHVHLLAGLRPHPSVAAIVKAIKGSSSHWINEGRRTPDHFAWQEGYAAFTVSPSVLRRVQGYVEQQEQHHKRRSFELEMIHLLKKHGLSIQEGDLDR